MTISAIDICRLLNGEIEGNPDVIISKAGKIEYAEPGDITFISNPLYEKYFITTKADAVIVSKDFKNTRNDITLIRVTDPYTAFITVLEKLEPVKEIEMFSISDKCVLGENVELNGDVFIGDFVRIGNGAGIGGGTRIMHNCTIGNKVKIGSNCMIHSNVAIYDDCKLGNNVIIHSGTVIGSDGFGFLKQENGSFKKIPQTGIVVIEDEVEIGSNTSIDRATIGETRICRGAKLDNQVQIAHNVEIGEDTVVVAQVGIAGSTKIGKRCMIAGQAGIVGHLTICDDVIIGASVGVSKSITKPGVYVGYRAKPMREELKETALIKEISNLKDRIKELEKSKS